MAFYPPDWPRLTRATKLQSGDFALLTELNHAPVLVGRSDDFTLAIFLDGDPSAPTLIETAVMSGSAHRFVDVEFELDPTSGRELDLVNSPIGCLIAKGDRLLIAARPPSKVGYVAVEIASLGRAAESEIAFAYSRWRIVKRSEDGPVVLYDNGEKTSLAD